MSTNLSTESKIFYKSVFALVLPMAIQNLINVAVTSADVIMLGKEGETALSGSSLAGQVQFILTLFFFGLTSGAAILTAQYWGKGDTRTIEIVMGIALRFALIVGVIFTAAVLLFPYPIMRIFSPEEDVIREGVRYLRVVAPSYLFMSVTIIYLNIMRSVERVIISTVVYLVSLFLNIILNAIFIFGLLGCPAMGIAGAALGTTIARGAELAIVLLYSARNKVVRLRVRDIFVHDKLLLSDFIRYSLPVTLNELMWGAGISMNAVIIGHMGSSAVAANSVAQVTRNLATVVAFGIANAAAIMIGKKIGENDYGRAEDYANRFVKLTLAAGVAGGLIILLVRPIVMATMNVTPEAHRYMSVMMLIMSYYVIAQAYNTTMVVGIFRAGGDAKFGLIMDVSTMWGGSILLGAIFAFVFHWSVPAVYAVIMGDELIKVPLTTIRYKSKKWLRNVTR